MQSVYDERIVNAPKLLIFQRQASSSWKGLVSVQSCTHVHTHTFFVVMGSWSKFTCTTFMTSHAILASQVDKVVNFKVEAGMRARRTV